MVGAGGEEGREQGGHRQGLLHQVGVQQMGLALVKLALGQPQGAVC